LPCRSKLSAVTGVHCRAATVFTDAVVAPGHRIAAVIKQFGEHLDGDAGVGVTLGIAVPVAIRRDLGFVDLDASPVRKAGKLATHSRCRPSSVAMLIGLRPSGLRRGAGSRPIRQAGCRETSRGLAAADQ
jgi:hypothetical protein